MQFYKIDFLKDVRDIEKIEKGYSGALKYVFSKEGKKYFLKIGQFQLVDNLEELFASNSISHPTIIDFGKYDDNTNYIIEEYIDGKNLKEELDNHAPKFIYEYGFLIGQQYRVLREIYPDKPMTEEKFQEYFSSVKECVLKLKSLIKSNGKLTEKQSEFLNYMISYLSENTFIIRNSCLVFGHTDIKPSNYLIYNKDIFATDIEYTDFKELSLSMKWSFARFDFKDEKNLAFARGYMDALYSFAIPDKILDCFNYTYLFQLAKYFIRYMEKDKYDKLSPLIEHINKNYMKDGEIKISEQFKRYRSLRDLNLVKESTVTLVKGSYNSCNLTFKCQTNTDSYFLKIMEMSSSHYKKAKDSYDLLKSCFIPISPMIKHGCIYKDKCYYTIFKFIELKEMDESIGSTFLDGFKSGELVASYLIKLKDKKLEKAETFDKKHLYKNMVELIEKIYGDNEKNKYIYWSKREVINYINKYISSYDDEPIQLIHGDVKFDNILYNGNQICFVDNESLQYSYDIINFMYNIQNGFLEKENLCYRGFVNGYLKYMNHGKIPYRMQNQAKLLLIYYVLRITSAALDNKYDASKLKKVLQGCKLYIDEDRNIEWLN